MTPPAPAGALKFPPVRGHPAAIRTRRTGVVSRCVARRFRQLGSPIRAPRGSDGKLYGSRTKRAVRVSPGVEKRAK